MTIHLPADIERIVKQAVASGRGTNETDVVRQALCLYEQFQCRRETLRQEIEKGIQSGDSIPADVVFQELEELARDLATNAPAATP